MRSMETRRAALLAGVATVAAAALTGCGAGQVAQTAAKQPSVYGVNADNADHSVLVRDLAVSYGAVQGYPADGNAPLEFGLYNQTHEPVTVRIDSPPPTGGAPGVVSARAVQLTGGTVPVAASSGTSASSAPAQAATSQPTPAQTAPSGSASAGRTGVGQTKPDPRAGSGSTTPASTTGAVPPPRPAEVTIPALSSVTFHPGDAEGVQLVGLSNALRSGYAVNLVLTFSNGVQPLTVLAPVGVPMSPVPRGSADVDEIHEAG